MANMIFNLDLNKNNAINPIIFGRLTDGNLRKITVNITHEGEPVDLTDWVIRFEGTTGGRAKVFDALGVNILDAKNGKFEYTFSKTAFSASGAYTTAYFAIEKDDMRETTNDIKIIVENVADLNAQEAETVVTELNKTITLINQRYAELNGRVDIYEDDIASLEGWLLGKKTEIENIIESANSTFNQKLSEIQAKLDETNQAIENGDFYSKTETDQKLSAINTTITNHTSNNSNPHAVTASQTGAYTKGEVDSKLVLKAIDSEVVHKENNEIISGSKTFTGQTVVNNLEVTGNLKLNSMIGEWVNIPLLTGYAVGDGQTPQVRKVRTAEGLIRIDYRGAIGATSGNLPIAQVTVGTIPTDFLPLATVLMQGSDNTGRGGRIACLTSGEMKILAPNTSAYVYLNSTFYYQ